MSDKFFTFIVLISILWVGIHLTTYLMRYSKESDFFNNSFMENSYWSGYSVGSGLFNRIFGRTTIVFS